MKTTTTVTGLSPLPDADGLAPFCGVESNLMNTTQSVSKAQQGSAHTPGPWKTERIAAAFCSEDAPSLHICGNYERDDGGDVVYGDTIASVTTKFAEGGRNLSEEEALANARLIAAAPELLEALRAIQVMAADYGIDSEKQRQLKAGHIAKLAEQAIARATS